MNLKSISAAIILLLLSLPAAAQETFSNYVNGLPVQSPLSSDYLYLLHNGASAKVLASYFSTSASPTFTGTVTMPDGSTWTDSGLSIGGCTPAFNGICTLQPGSSASSADGGYNTFTITQDAIAAPIAYIGWLFKEGIGGSTKTGVAEVLDVAGTFNAPTSPSNTNRNYVGGVLQMTVTSGDNGTISSAKGSAFGANIVVRCNNGATYWYACEGAEIDAVAATGSSMNNRLGLSLVAWGQVNGSVNDAALQVGTASGNTASWGTALLLAKNVNGAAPLLTTGCVVCTDGISETIATGIDLSAYTISGYFLKDANFSVTGAGVVTGGSFIPTSSTAPTNGIYLEAANTPTIAANGTPFEFAQGGLYYETALTAGTYFSFQNTSTSSASTATTRLQFGNNTSVSEAAMALNGSNNANGNGVNSFTINAAAGMWLEGNGNIGLNIDTSGHLFAPSLATTPTGKQPMCIDTSTHEIYAGTGGGC